MAKKLTPAMIELAKRLEQKKAPKFSVEKFCFDKQIEFIRSPGRFKVASTSTRAGKCLKSFTKIKTPTGYKYIQDMQVGDLVYGVNADGSISLTPVKQVYNQGVQTVVDLKHYGVTIATSTENHRWLFYRAQNKSYEVAQLDNKKHDYKLAYKNVDIPGGSIHQPYAYVLGALLGDGCARERHLSISGDDIELVSKIESILNHVAVKNHSSNYTWHFKKFDKSTIPYYIEWMHNKYAHEKVCDYEIIKMWDRESQIEFLSGLIDTDGSVSKTKDGRVWIRLSMQAKAVIDCAKNLFEDLFQARPNIRIDNRKKYKNGPVYDLVISNNKFTLPILKELRTVCKRKQYKPEYELLGQDESNIYVGFAVSEPYQAQCWDIELENETHLYLLNNGLVTHNTNSIIADMLDKCVNERDIVVAYFTISANSARNIIWGELKKVIEDYNINADINETTMRIRFPETRSEIRVNGANNEAEIEKVRGWKLRAAYVDECFHGDTLVETSTGDVPIRDVKIGDEVKSAIGFRKIVSLSKKQKENFVKLNYGGKIIKSSENHPFFTTRGWVRASELRIGDYLVTTNSAMRMLSKGLCAASQNEEILLKQLWEEVGVSRLEVKTSIQRCLLSLQKGNLSGVIRLDGIEVLKCSSDDTNREGYFYDIGVEGHPSFTVNGALVHNCQSFRGYLKYFVEAILMSRLRDQAGTLMMTGTPGASPSGYFYEIYHNPNSWKKFHWTCFDNPHMKNLEEVLAEERAASGITEDDPSYQREVYGRWVQDVNSLVYKFNPAINLVDSIPNNLEYVFGVDLGYNDADAIAVLGYNDKNVYLVEEVITTKQGISELAEQIKALEAKYKPTKIVYDGGALGLKIGIEIQQRYGINMTPAQKERKIEFIELLNDDLRTGRFKTLPGTRFQEDCGLVLWDKNVVGNAKKISDSYHSDVNEAVLYAWKSCMHYLEAPPKVERPEIRSLTQLEEQIAKESAEVDAAKRGEVDNVSEEDLLSIFDVYGEDNWG